MEDRGGGHKKVYLTFFMLQFFVNLNVEVFYSISNK